MRDITKMQIQVPNEIPSSRVTVENIAISASGNIFALCRKILLADGTGLMNVTVHDVDTRGPDKIISQYTRVNHNGKSSIAKIAISESGNIVALLHLDTDTTVSIYDVIKNTTNTIKIYDRKYDDVTMAMNSSGDMIAVGIPGIINDNGTAGSIMVYKYVDEWKHIYTLRPPRINNINICHIHGLGHHVNINDLGEVISYINIRYTLGFDEVLNTRLVHYYPDKTNNGIPGVIFRSNSDTCQCLLSTNKDLSLCVATNMKYRIMVIDNELDWTYSIIHKFNTITHLSVGNGRLSIAGKKKSFITGRMHYMLEIYEYGDEKWYKVGGINLSSVLEDHLNPPIHIACNDDLSRILITGKSNSYMMLLSILYKPTRSIFKKLLS